MRANPAPPHAAAPDTEALFAAWETALRGDRQATVVDGLVREVTEGCARSVYAYSPAGDLISIREPDGTRWDYGYGADGRLLSVARDGAPCARYGYDPAGRLTVVDRPDGARQHVYDPAGRLVRTLRGDAGAFAYRYDDRGRVRVARSELEETRFDYDADGRLVRLEQVVDGVAAAVQLEFDGAQRLARLAFAPWGVAVSFTWDERGRPRSVHWRGEELWRCRYDDTERRSVCDTGDGLREETWHHPQNGRVLRKRLYRGDALLWQRELSYGAGFRLAREGERSYDYDEQGRLRGAAEGDRQWRFHHSAMDDVLGDGGAASPVEVAADAADRVRSIRRGRTERVYRYNQAGEMQAALDDGELRAACSYDHKGRLLHKRGASGTERYLYGPDDALLAIMDGAGRPLWIFVRLPTGLVGAIDLRSDPQGTPVYCHSDGRGSLVFIGAADGTLEGPLACDPFGLPLSAPAGMPFVYKERLFHADLGLYWIGCRFYDPALRRFLTADSYTGAPDDERLVNPFCRAAQQRLARAQILGEWLKQPRVRNRHAYCSNDPVNRCDPNGHWSFGGVLLSILGAIWTLPNTLFGLAVEITCLVGEVIRWLVWLFSFGHASWQTPGFDAAASGRLNAFALVFTGGWIGSLGAVLGITFGNVIFIDKEWKSNWEAQALPAMVAPPAYNGSVTFPKDDALYEHELRHVNQYSWFGPFFHLGLPIFGVFEWDVIFNGVQNAWNERDARYYGGF